MPRSTTGIVSGITASLESDKPDLQVQRLIREPEGEALWRSGFRGINAEQKQFARNMGRYGRYFNQNYPGIMERELGTIGDYFDGGIQSQLAGFRSNENNLFNAALDRGLGGLDRGFGASAVAGGYSPRSSYGQRIREGARTGLMLQNAMRQAGQERSDFSNLEAAKLGLVGRTLPIMDAMMNPSRMKTAHRGFMQNLTQQQLAMDPGIYNIWRKRGSMEMATDILDSLAQGAYKGASAYATFAGMGGGGMGGMGGGGGGGGGGGQSQVGTNSGPTNSGSFGGVSGGSSYTPQNFGAANYNPGSVSPYGPPANTYQGSSGNQFNDWWSSPGGGY